MSACLGAVRDRIVAATRRWASVAADDILLSGLFTLRTNLEILWLFDLEREIDSLRPGLASSTAFGHVGELVALPREGVARVLASPLGTTWHRHGRALLQSGDEAALRDHLDGFAALALSAAVLSGVPYGPIEAWLPARVSLPGLGLGVQRADAGSLTLATKDGQLLVRAGSNEVRWPGEGRSTATADLRIVASPRISGLAACLEVDDPVFRMMFPWVDDPAPFDAETWVRRLTGSVSLLDCVNSGMRAEMARNLQVVVPTSRGCIAKHSTGSNRNAWGAVNTTLVPEPWFTDGLIHEHRHDLLNTLLLVEDVVEPDASSEETLYSPWRPEPRHTIGIYHAIFVFVAVANFYEQLLDAGVYDLETPRSEVATALGLQSVRLQVGAEELRSGGGLSDFGSRLLDDITEAGRHLHAAAMRHHAFDGNTVRNELLRHYEDWRHRGGRRAHSDVSRIVAQWT